MMSTIMKKIDPRTEHNAQFSTQTLAHSLQRKCTYVIRMKKNIILVVFVSQRLSVDRRWPT